MKMFKYIFFAGAVCTAAFLAGCNEDEYTENFLLTSR